MRTSALLALLPLLVSLATARPYHSGHDHSVHRAHRIRKSLSFGPTHSHASFEVIDEPVTPQGLRSGDVDVKEVARRFIGEKVGAGEGDGFYIREDVSSASSFVCCLSSESMSCFVVRSDRA